MMKVGNYPLIQSESLLREMALQALGPREQIIILRQCRLPFFDSREGKQTIAAFTLVLFVSIAACIFAFYFFHLSPLQLLLGGSASKKIQMLLPVLALAAALWIMRNTQKVLVITNTGVLMISVLPILHRRLTSRFDFKDIDRVDLSPSVSITLTPLFRWNGSDDVTLHGGSVLSRRTLRIPELADPASIAEQIRMYAKNGGHQVTAN